MRNLALMWVLAGVALLSASLYVHSETIDSADVDYCIDWTNRETVPNRERASFVRLLFVKKNNDLKFTRDSIKCIGDYSYSHYYTFYFTDKLGQKVFSSESTFALIGGYKTNIDSTDTIRIDNNAKYTKQSPSEIQINFPQRASHKTTSLEKNNKDVLLKFKNKIIDANIQQKFICERGLDTTIYRMDFRVRITGECGCDSIKESQK